MGSLSKKEEEVSLITPLMAMKVRKILKGHRGRVLHFDWSADKSHIITAGQVCVCVCERERERERERECVSMHWCVQGP